MKIAVLAYAAGLIDGEGHIGLVRRNQSRLRKPLLSVSNTEIALLKFLRCHFGGAVILNKEETPRTATCWEWHLFGDPLLRLLPKLIPLMRDRKKLARARMLVRGYKKVGNPRGVNYTPEKRERRLRFEKDFMALPTQRSRYK